MNTISAGCTATNESFVSPVPEQKFSVSFHFGICPVPTKDSTAIKHSPIARSHPNKKPVAKAVKETKKIATTTKTAKTTKTPKATKARAQHVKHFLKRKGSSTEVDMVRPRAKWCGLEDDRMMWVLEKMAGEDFQHKVLKVNWGEVAERMKTGRNAKQCRDRWMNYLRPGLKKGDWSTHEEDQIKEMYHTFGPKWCTMAKMLPNRAENDIKNKWYSMMRKQKRCEAKVKADLNSWANRPVDDNSDTHSLGDSTDILDKAQDNEKEESIIPVPVQPQKPKGRGKELSRLLAAMRASI